jgi:hypothetical protein
VVVDGDVDELPAGRPAGAACRVAAAWPVAAGCAAADAFAGAARDPAELLAVDVDELARSRVLVANGLLETGPAKTAALEHRRNG